MKRNRRKDRLVGGEGGGRSQEGEGTVRGTSDPHVVAVASFFARCFFFCPFPFVFFSYSLQQHGEEVANTEMITVEKEQKRETVGACVRARSEQQLGPHV